MRKSGEILQVPENREKINCVLPIDKKLSTLYIASVARDKKAAAKREQVNFAPKPDDLKIIRAGMQKHGVDKSQIIRMALRRFAEAEGLELAS